VADGATNTLANVTTNIAGDVTVATNGAFTLLVLSDNALLTNSANGIIGLNSTARSNEVRLITASARWRVGGSLLVGSNGAMSRLVVSNGALLADNNGRLAFGVTSSNNVALVTGSGSLWSNANTLTIGNSGRNNQLIVSNGGWVVNQNGDVGGNATASNNLALVTGSGSVWSNASNLRVGALSPGNRLVIESGGLVRSAGGTVGQSGSASNNSVLVTGPGSVWTNDGGLLLGSQIGFNRLVVSNGAAVRSASGGMGSLAAAVSNQVVVTGAGSLWNNQTTLFVGGNSVGNRADVNDGGWLVCSDGSVGLGFSGNSNTVVLSGASGWDNLGTLKVGDGGSGNMLIASNGATVLSSNAFIGANTSLGNNNLAVITGAGTLWSNRSDLTVGNFSFGNRLVAGEGATVFVGGHGVIGANSGASSNSVVVTDPETHWLVASNLYLGSNGSFSTLVVSNGGSTAHRIGYLGVDVSSSNNLALVTGTNSVMTNRIDLRVGQLGSGNRLVISNGGRLESSQALLGFQFSSGNNEAVVTGAGSVWNASAVLDVGLLGSGNRFVVSSGGWMRNTFAEIGVNTGSSNNLALVTGVGSSWTNAGLLRVGSFGSRNALVVNDQGLVSTKGVIIGSETSSTNNRSVVDGGTLLTSDAGLGALDIRRGTNVLKAGLIDVDQLILKSAQGFFEFNGGTLITRGAFVSNGPPFIVGYSGTIPAVWDVRAGLSNHVITGDLLVGNNDASFNQLLVTNGAVVRNNDGILGFFSSRNLALLSGAGSIWSNANDLYVGRFGAGNQLVVSNGAFVRNNNGYLGFMTFSSSNLAVVTGLGSIWSNAVGVFIGQSGPANRLMVDNGGVMLSGEGDLGVNVSSSNNVAIVTGSGSVWSNSDVLQLGISGKANQLVVSNGGVVASVNGLLGVFDSSSNNEAVITGAGSFWKIVGSLSVGREGGGNRLVVSDGGAVFADDDVRLGVLPTSANNRIEINGGSLLVTNALSNDILDVRRGTAVLNAGLIEADIVRMTNPPQNVLEFNGGTLTAKSSKISSGTILRLGNGVSSATMMLAGNGVHDFGGNLLVSVSSNAVLTGNGTLVGGFTISRGGKLIPGGSVGKMVFSNSPALQGAVIMEISKNGAILTNDQIQVMAPLTYGGSLVISNLGPTALTVGERFPLFTATSFAGSFSNIVLPPLASGLDWTNKLSVDGSIEVIAPSQPAFTSITLSGTNIVIAGTNGPAGANYSVLTATNVALPLSNWVSIATNQFDSSGNFSFTRTIVPGERQRYFRIRIP
jgi:T5SS/PEP-CTERM-associated repeat protein